VGQQRLVIVTAAALTVVLGGCVVPFVVPRKTLVNVTLSVTTEPEEHSKVYVSRGSAARVRKTGPHEWTSEDVTYGDRQLVGTTPCSVPLGFQSTGKDGVWDPPQYAVYVVDSLGKEASCGFGPWTSFYTDSAGVKHQTLYSEEFPLDYFVKHPNVSPMNVSTYFRVKGAAGK